MAKARLLQAVCTVAMLAAVPAFAQSNNPQSQTGASATPSAPAAPQGAASQPVPATGSSMSQNDNSSMAPAGTPSGNSGMSNGSSSTASGMHRMHHAAMNGHAHHMARAENSGAQDAAVDQLNDESLRAAQQGQSFNAASTGTMAPASSNGSMNDMSGGSMHNGSMSGGSMSGGSSSGGGASSDTGSGSSGTGGKM